MYTQMRFRINTPEVVSESFGGEIVAIHFGSGNYYSLTGAALEVLALLDGGSTVGEVVENLTRRYDGRSFDIGSEIHNFVAELLQENLIVACESDEAAGEVRRNVEQDPLPLSSKADFQPPSLEKYGDMQDLLLLDPIHDVDEVGWPSALPDTRSAG